MVNFNHIFASISRTQARNIPAILPSTLSLQNPNPPFPISISHNCNHFPSFLCLHSTFYNTISFNFSAMVVALGPGKFYGSSLPRPRFYTDVKLNSERVDPPLPVMDPLLKWADEAHWSMGGLSFKRLRLQGRIEGNVERLRTQRDRAFKRSHRKPAQKSSAKPSESSDSDEPEESHEEVSKTPTPPPAPLAIKRRRVIGLLDDEEDAGEVKRGPVRKLRDEFERVAVESGLASDYDGSKRKEEKKRTRKLVKGGGKVEAPASLRKSPRLSRTRLN